MKSEIESVLLISSQETKNSTKGIQMMKPINIENYSLPYEVMVSNARPVEQTGTVFARFDERKKADDFADMLVKNCFFKFAEVYSSEQ